MSHITSVIARSSNNIPVPSLTTLAANALDIGFWKGRSAMQNALHALVARKNVNCVKVNAVITPKAKSNTWLLTLLQGPDFYGPLTVFGVAAKDIVSAICIITHVSDNGTKLQLQQPLDVCQNRITFPKTYNLRSKCDVMEIVITLKEPVDEEDKIKQIVMEQYVVNLEIRNALGTQCALPEGVQHALTSERKCPIQYHHRVVPSTQPCWGNTIMFQVNGPGLERKQLLSATLHLKFKGKLPNTPIEKVGFECCGFVWQQFRAMWIEAAQQILRWPAPLVETKGDITIYSLRMPFGFDSKMLGAGFPCTPYNRRDLGVHQHSVFLDLGGSTDEHNVLLDAVLDLELESLNVYEPHSCMLITCERFWTVSSTLVLEAASYVIFPSTKILYLRADNPETNITMKINKAVYRFLAKHHRIGDWFVVPFDYTLTESDEMTFEFSTPVTQFTMIPVGLDTQANPNFIGQLKIIQA